MRAEGVTRMPNNRTASPRERFFFGIVFAFCGAFPLCLAAAGVIAPRSADAPFWLAALTSAIFLLAGGMLMISALVPATEDGSLPRNAPLILRLAQYILSLCIAAALSVAITWIAFGPGERHFTTSGIGFSDINALFGRAAFGIGAVAMWCFFVLMAVQGMRSLRGPGPSEPTIN
jgi:hypothetical protein